jgi:hypothetical protein
LMAVYNLAKEYISIDRDSSLSPCGRGWLAEPVGRGGQRSSSRTFSICCHLENKLV